MVEGATMETLGIENENKMSGLVTIDKKPNRGGMMAFNLCGQVLLVSVIGKKDQWVFPKGHIEKDETPETTAVRECYEETGVIVSALTKIGNTTFIKAPKGEEVIVEWWSGFAVRKVNNVSTDNKWFETDFRDSKWVSVEEAFKLLAFENLKIILRKALCLE